MLVLLTIMIMTVMMRIKMMPVVITGKGWRATVRPQAKNAFSRLLVTNLLDLANIFSENYHCEDIYTYLKAIVKNLLGLANIFSAKFCFCFHSANCHINDFARFVTKKTLSRLTVVIIFFVPCDDNYDCVNFKGCNCKTQPSSIHLAE